MHDLGELSGMSKQKKFILNFILYSISKYFKHISRVAFEIDLAKSLGSDRGRSPLGLKSNMLHRLLPRSLTNISKIWKRDDFK